MLSLSWMTATVVVEAAEEEVVEAEVAAHRQMIIGAAVLLDAGKMTMIPKLAIFLSGFIQTKVSSRDTGKLCNAVSAVSDMHSQPFLTTLKWFSFRIIQENFQGARGKGKHGSVAGKTLGYG